MNRQCQWSGRAIAAACLSILASLTAGAQDVEKGVLWETTAQASIPGMPVNMPAYKAKVCQKEEWSEPPPSNDPSQNCKNTSFNRAGNKITWTMACENPPMTGDGEMTFNGTDSYEGIIRMQGAGMNMQINMTGRKIGTCDNPT